MVLSRRSLLVACAALAVTRPAIAGSMRLASYHNQPPFMVTPTSGMTFDLADYLEARLGLPVAAEIIPRNRLDSELLASQRGILVPWISPSWLPPRLLELMVFSPPLLSDENVVISNAAKPIEYDGPDSLIGYRMGIVTGRIHAKIDKLVAAGKIVVSKARSPALNLEMLASDRVDFVIMPGATWRALVPADRRAQFHLARRPQESFTRHIMLPRTDNMLAEKISVIVSAMPEDASWHRILEAYDLDNQHFSPFPT